MGLEYPDTWRFDVGEKMPAPAVQDFLRLVERVASQAKDAKPVYEIFKSRFGVDGTSSSVSWAQSDMVSAFNDADLSIPAFIEAYWSGMQDCSEEFTTPSVDQLNAVLQRHRIGYLIQGNQIVEQLGAAVLTGDADVKNIRSGYVLVGDPIGKGAFGEVYRATRTTPVGTFTYALKFHRPMPYADALSARKRFEREVAALAKLQHRSIVTLVDAGLEGTGSPFLVMQFIDGKNVRDAIAAWDAKAAVRCLQQVLEGLEHAHQLNVFHRDIKPSNVLLRTSDSQPIIVDFGLAYLLEDATVETLTSLGGVGSGPYVPPEIHNEPKARNPLHDVFSCGVLLYELIARKVPVSGDYDPLAAQDPRLAGLDEVIKKATAPKSRRYQTAREFLVALRAVESPLEADS